MEIDPLSEEMAALQSIVNTPLRYSEHFFSVRDTYVYNQMIPGWHNRFLSNITPFSTLARPAHTRLQTSVCGTDDSEDHWDPHDGTVAVMTELSTTAFFAV